MNFGMYYYYHRYYKPEIGRFLNEDPIGMNGGFNLYKFVGNDPTNWVDLFGLFRDDLLNNEKVRIQICCLIDKSGYFPGESFKGENSGVVYEHNSVNDLLLTECGQGRGGFRSNESKFYKPQGFHFEAYFHTHPPGGNEVSLGRDSCNGLIS